MAMQKGSALTLSIGNGAAPETFTPVAGAGTRRLTLGAAVLDLTDTASPGQWRELAAGQGVRQMTVSGAGLLRNAAADSLVRDAFLTQAARNWRVVAPGLATFTGPFLVTGLEFTGAPDGEVDWTITLASAGALQITGGGGGP